MGESGTVKSGARLEVSISFGRYEGDALSWEKWSSFSPNKYLEEVGNLSTPGSVAQKKAYFEAHYSRIAAARRAAAAQGSDEVGHDDDQVGDPSTGGESRLPSGDELVEAVEGVYGMDLSTMKIIDAEEGEKSTAIADEKANDSSVTEALELEVGLEAALVQVLNSANDGCRRIAGKELDREEPTTMERENYKLSATEVAGKKTPKEGGVPPVIEPSPAPNLRKVKANSNSKPTFASKSLQKKGSRSLVPNRMNFEVGECKRAGRSSSMVSVASSAPSVSKESLTTEKTQEDTVKRAIKSSYNRASISSTDKNINAPKQLSSSTSAPKRFTPLTQARGRAGLRRDSEKIKAQSTNQSESRLKPFPSSSYKSSEKKFSTAVSPSVGLRSDERAEKRKEFLKKLEAKSIAREAANTQLRAKSKEEKESQIRKLRQNLNFKAKPLPSFYKDQRKVHIEKDK